MTEEVDLRKFILERRDQLTRQQQKLGSYILEHMSEIPFLAVPILAEKAGVSEATIVRFSQRLGFDGFSGLKQEFVTHLHRKQEAPMTSTGDSSINMVFDQELANLWKCLDANDIKTITELAESLAAAHTVHFFGAGASSIMAEYAAYMFNQIGVRAYAVPSRYSSPLEHLVFMQKEDHLCCFSFPPYSETTISLLKSASERGVPTTAFCDRITAPIAQWADQTLVTPSEGMMFTNSMTALMAMLNSLTTEVGKICGARTFEAVDHINKTLAIDPNILH